MIIADAPSRRSGKGRAVSPAYRLEVASRSLLAVAGGFALASGAALLVAALLGAAGALAPAPAVHAATSLSWAVWVPAAMWAFHAGSQVWAWLSTVGLAALLGGAALLIGFGA